MTRHARLAVPAVAAAFVAAQAIVGGAPAQASTPTSSPRATAAAASGAATPGLKPRGIIIKTSGSAVGLLSVAAATQSTLAAVGEPDAGVAVGPAIAPSTRVLLFDQPVDDIQAEAVARVLQQRTDVVWAEPDRPVRLLATPVIPNDPRFGQQWDLWDSQGSGGGYSVKAPLIWGKTKGSSSIVVAVVDTGFTSHPDLNANVVPGYDFISDVAVANDGNARDPDPSDPGDWITPSENASGDFQDCGVSDSSWHGTHVAGTIAGIQDNGIGISGIAPGVRIQSIRALGKCGGYTSDIAAGIRWAVGGSVPGVPANPTPAKVVNLSLGGAGTCSSAEQDAVDFVRSQGAVMVVAAGNESQPVSTSSPANCDGVIAVAAVGRDGGMATYSNYGQKAGQITLAAPGGDTTYDSGILSTINTGATSPASPSYSAYEGTSMATPHVSAAAALLYSLGVAGTDAVKAALVKAVQPFPTDVWNLCTSIKCGAGILDLSKISSGGSTPTAPGAPTGVTAVAGDGEALVSWTAPANNGGAALGTYTATAMPGGSFCTSNQTSCTIPLLTNGTTYTVTVTVNNAADLESQPSAPVSVTPTGGALVTVPGVVSGVRVSWKKVGAAYTAILRWSAPTDTGGAAIDGYRARLGRVGSPYGSWLTLTQASVSAPRLRVGVTYRVQIQAHNSSGYGATFTQVLRP